MMLLMARFLLACMIGFWMVAFAALPARALTLEAVRTGVHSDKTRMVLELNEASDFRVFVLDDPYRLVIDLPDFTWAATAVQNAPGSLLGDVRHGQLQPGVSRIVFDTQGPVALKNAFVLPQQGDMAARLVIDFSGASREDFQAVKSRVLGTLETAPVNLQAPSRTARSGAETRQAGTIPASIMPPPSKPSASKSDTPARKPLVIVDPGHGGQDPGAHGANGVNEKQVTLALARELRDQLEATGHYRVMMTRDSDVFIKLGDRVKFARKNNGDLFVSIHADSINKADVGGASVYTLSDKASDAQTAKLADRENQADLIGGIDLSAEDEDVANILVDLAMRDTMNQSRFFAGSIVDTLAYHGVRVLERPHRYAGFAVLKAPDIPSILIEAGFMSNRREANLLSSPEHRRKIAEALVSGIDTYFQTVNGAR